MQSAGLPSPFNISVIIPTKDRHHQIIACLDAIHAQTCLPNEIIVVDSSANDKVKNEMAKSDYPKTNVIYIHSSPGLTLQRNIGVKAASGDLIAFLDDDIVLDPDYFEHLLPAFANDKENRVGGVTGRITNELRDRRSLFSFVRFLTFFSYPSYGQVRVSGFHTEYNGYEKPLKVEWLPGVVVYRKEVFNEFSFDENLRGYAYNEDLDFSYRVSRKYECLYIPSAKMVHNKSQSRLSSNVATALVVNNNYLLHKNILPGKNLAMKFVHLFTFYIAIFSFLFFMLITCRFTTFKGGLRGLREVWFGKKLVR